MEKITQFHKLITYTDSNMIYYAPKTIVISVYVQAVISKELAFQKNYPCSEVVSNPILINIRVPLGETIDSDEDILIRAECLAQIAAISPDVLNLFGTKKGINITELLLVSSQPMLRRYVEFDDCHISSDFSYNCLQWRGLYLYGSVSRDIKKIEADIALSFLNDRKKDKEIYDVPFNTIYKRLYIKSQVGRVFLTRKAIEDFLALPQIFTCDNIEITRPFRAVFGIFNNAELREPYADSLWSAKSPNEKVFLATNGMHKFRIILVEDEKSTSKVKTYVVVRIATFLQRERVEEHKENGTDQFSNKLKNKEQLKNKQNVAAEGKLG